jgi:hypothetical protein
MSSLGRKAFTSTHLMAQLMATKMQVCNHYGCNVKMWTLVVWLGIPIDFAWLGNLFNAFAIKWDLLSL